MQHQTNIPKIYTALPIPEKIGTFSLEPGCKLRSSGSNQVRAGGFSRGRLLRAGAINAAPLEPTSLVTFLFGHKKVTHKNFLSKKFSTVLVECGNFGCGKVAQQFSMNKSCGKLGKLPHRAVDKKALPP